MAQTSGQSVNGRQVLFAGAVPSPTLFVLTVGPAVLPPSERVGYYFLYAIEPSFNNRCYVIDFGPVWTPGIYRRANMVGALGGSIYRYEVRWDFPLLSWQFTIA